MDEKILNQSVLQPLILTTSLVICPAQDTACSCGSANGEGSGGCCDCGTENGGGA